MKLKIMSRLRKMMIMMKAMEVEVVAVGVIISW